MQYRDYMLYLIDGTTLWVTEQQYKPAHKTLLGRFQTADPDTVLMVDDCVSGVICVPKRNILYIKAESIRKVE